MKKNTLFICLSFLLLVFTFSIKINGQETRGAIRGLVMDPNNAPVPGAKVTVKDTERGTSITVTSNSDGFFQANYLLSGNYLVSVEASGFKRLLKENVIIAIGETRQFNLNLEVGIAQETVTVTADTQNLNTENASVAQTIDSRKISELPLPKGDPYKLMGTATGVAHTGSQRLDRPFEPTHIVGYAIDGTRGNRSDLTIDGVSSTSTANANEVIASYVPPSDIVQEFKVQTATFDAQFGNTEGGVTSISIKSGTNSLHGTGYYFTEPLSLTALDAFGKARGQAKPQNDSKRFGGSISGPIMFPWLYNGKDKSFFLFGYEGIRDSRPRFDANNIWVPTDALKNGDFSAYGVTIWDPASRIQVGSNFVAQTGWSVIPTARISPVAKKILEFYTAPKVSGTTLRNNIADSSLTEVTDPYNNWTFRIDQNLTSKNRMFVRGSYYDRLSFYNEYMPDSPATGVNFIFASRQGVIDDVHVFNGSTVLNVRYGYNRFIRQQDQEEDARGFDLTRLGMPATFNNFASDVVRRFPRLDFTGGSGSNMLGTGFGNETRPTTTHNFSAILNKTFGTHSSKFGAELRIYREDSTFKSNDQTMFLTFNNTYTKQASNTSTPDTDGLQAFGAFLLGLPTTATITRRADYSEYSKTWGFFFQDDWKVNNRLTLNFGLRYELEEALKERNGKSIKNFDVNYVQQAVQDAARAKLTASPVTGMDGNSINPASFNVRGGLVFAQTGEALYNTPKDTILPRFGIAYRWDDKTVIRGGFGLFAGFLGQRRGDVIQPGFTRTTQVSLTTNAAGAPIPFDIVTGFQNTAILEPVGSAQGFQTNLGGGITFFNQDPEVSKQLRYQAGFQRELPWGFFLEAMYVGNYGYDIERTVNINALPNQYLNTDNFRSTAMVNNNTLLGQAVSNPFAGLSQFTGTGFINTTIARQQLLRPFVAFGDINTTVNDGKSWYNSGQFVLNKRVTAGFTAQLSYTFSKWIQQTEVLNAADPTPTKMIGDQDVPHRFSMNYIYTLPFGRGQMWGSGISRVADAFIGGWQFSGVYTYQSGFPIAFGNVFYQGGKISINSTNSSGWFNRDAFLWNFNNTSAASTAATPVSNLRTFPMRFSDVRRDSVNNMDFSLLKDIRFNETMKIRLTLELYNAFNEPYFPAPSTSATTALGFSSGVWTGFGTISPSNQDNYARRGQIGIKFIF